MEMEMNQDNTYEPLEGRRRIESTDSPDMETTPPRDRNGILYIALLAAGIGFVLPYNRYSVDTDHNRVGNAPYVFIIMLDSICLGNFCSSGYAWFVEHRCGDQFNIIMSYSLLAVSVCPFVTLFRTANGMWIPRVASIFHICFTVDPM